MLKTFVVFNIKLKGLKNIYMLFFACILDFGICTVSPQEFLPSVNIVSTRL